jgi:curved DNA-binding protein CbpA
METSKDYYATLGVLPSAEDVVIRAAYKALAQRYHPDRFEGSKDEALRRMQDINEAYAVLSDAVQRKEYDTLRGADTKSGASYSADDSNDVPPGYDPLESDWAAATKYYPDLVQVEARLSKIAWRLGYAFRAYLLDNKAFETCQQVAAQMEREFLELYFGTKPELVTFAKELIEAGHKKAAKALNEAVRIFGTNIDAPRVIKKIRDDFDLNDHFEDGLPKYSPPQLDAGEVNIHRSVFGRWKLGRGAIFLFVVACFVGIFVVDGYLKGREATARALIAQQAAQQAAQEEARKATEAIEAVARSARNIQRRREMQETIERAKQPSAGWVHVGRYADGSLYADATTKTMVGNVVNMWVLLDFTVPITVRGAPYSSIKRRDEFDCSYESIRSTFTTHYSRGMGAGDVTYSSQDSSGWSRVKMGSLAHTLWKIACGAQQ